MQQFAYNSIQTSINGNKRRLYTVTVKNNKGSKTVEDFIKNKKVAKKTIKLTRKEVKNIKQRKFMPGLWIPCIKSCNKQCDNL
jgi:hypothetical protein